MTDPAQSASEGELNLRIARPLLAYLADTRGEEVRDAVLAAGGVTPAEYHREDHWMFQEDFAELLAAGRRGLDDDEEFVKAGTYQIAEQYGPLSLVLRFTSVQSIVKTLDRTRHLVTRISRFEPVPLPDTNGLCIRYRSTKSETRLECLLRKSQWASIPSVIWGLPRAVITESRCIANGDDCCECELRWREPFRWRAPSLGLALGGAVALVLWLVTGWAWATPWPAVLGLVVGWHWGVMRERTTRESYQDAKALEAERFVSRHLQATQELLRLHERQAGWTAQLERQSLQSSHTLGAVLTRLQTLTEHDPGALRDISHDLRNPLTLVRTAADLLTGAIRDGADHETLDRYATHLGTGVERLNEMLDEVMSFADEQSNPKGDEAELKEMATGPLVERYRRQLMALTVERDLQISVELVREAPDRIETRPSILERVMDNLLTNAAKYTDRGRVHVEISGVPGYLMLKVADTGRGIREDRLEGVLTGESMDDDPLVGDSRGVGLSVVVRLLDRLGGRLELLSRPDMGTTFWIYVPTEPPERRVRTAGDEPIERVVRRVVSIRDEAAKLPELLH